MRFPKTLTIILLILINSNLFSENLLDLINSFRSEKGLSNVLESSNLFKAADSHNNYLIEEGIISHKGRNGSSAMKRCLDKGATALKFGEVIGFSPSLRELFNGWLESPTHLDVLLNPKWNWVGISLKEFKGVYIAVVNFSTGNLGSTEIDKDGDWVILKGKYKEEPEFTGSFKIKDFTLAEKRFKIIFKPEKEYIIIKAKLPDGNVSDRVEVFF